MNTSICSRCFIRCALRVATVVAAIAWMPLHYSTVSAQSAEPGPKPGSEQQKNAQAEADHAQTLTQLVHHIEALKSELQKTQERVASTNPQVGQIQQQLEALLGVQKRLRQISQRGELNQETLSDL